MKKQVLMIYKKKLGAKDSQDTVDIEFTGIESGAALSSTKVKLVISPIQDSHGDENL